MSHKGAKGSKLTSKRCTPTTSRVKLLTEHPQTSRTDLLCRKIEDEEFPHGFYYARIDDVTDRRIFYETKNLSLVAEFDEFMRSVKEYGHENVYITTEFLEYAKHQELCRIEWLKAVQECKRLQEELYKANHELGDFQIKLKNARRLLDQEKKIRKRVENERFNLEQQMMTARELLFNEQNWRIPEDTKEKLSFLNNISSKSSHLSRNVGTTGTRLNTICEVNSADINSTASLLSDFSYSRSDGELDTSLVFKIKSEEWKRVNKEIKSPKGHNNSSITRKVVEINPTDKIVATTTLSMRKDGPITATSIIEAVPKSESDSSSIKTEEIPHKSPPKKTNESFSVPVVSLIRCHSFASKTVLCPEPCSLCKARIRFGKMVVKCKDCKAVCHVECKNQLPVPCIPLLNLAGRKPIIGTISDYAPTTPPMVPALIRSCIAEIELRGLREIGLYRIPGVERDIRTLKERMLRAKILPNLGTFDVHVLCGVVKDFLRSLSEPLLTYSLRRDFIQAAEAKVEMDVISCMYQAISQLPQPNRDTLAYVMLHLNRVAATRECKMPSSNLARIFGPTIVGYSSDNVHGSNLLAETKQQYLVMDYLMKIPIDFWSSFIDLKSATISRTRNFFNTPSTESSKATRRKFFTPEGSSSSSSSTRKRKKYFTTPATYRK